MYLKRLHIQGFKSFADKTKIEFKKGITGIVGPNGSGKSNVSDAIRWVLGEQSIKTLRGNKMEDVIFSGTDKRKPLGYAEVTIVFDNKDGTIPIEYSEVSVTRRMFRSGESEYYINKNACRLKDIKELFMDTGVGKDGYSIIGQGRVDEILSTKSEDRRHIF
ncbi:AAA family ATPase, partial [Anaerosalibacter bizertensis]|nr:AAA family ATPase [Anaerosalibacter bizertensis]